MTPGGTFKWSGWRRTLEGELEPQPLLFSLCLPVACREEFDFICVPPAQRPQSQPTTMETSGPLSKNIPCLFLTYFSQTFCHSNTKLAQSGIISLMPDGSCRINAYFYKGGIFFFFEVFPLSWFQIRSNKSMAHDDHPQWTYNFSNPLSLPMEHKTEEANIIGLQISADHTRRGWKGGFMRAGINVS